MKKKYLFVRLSLALVVLLSTLATKALADSLIPPPEIMGGCTGIGASNHRYFTIAISPTSHYHNGANIFLWISWGGGYLGPLSPSFIMPTASGNYDYHYDASSLSHVNLPSAECYTVYFTRTTTPPNLNPVYRSAIVCPCPSIDINEIPWCSAQSEYHTNSFAPSTYYFTGGSSYVPLNPSASPYTWAYEWDFGDGSNSLTQNPVHTYSSAGSYTVCLTIKILQNGVEIKRCQHCREICVTQITEGIQWPDGSLRTTTSEGLKLQLTPNPASNTLNASINVTRARKTEVIILDAMGNTRFRTNASFTQDKRSIDIDTRDLPVGAYTLYIKSAEGVVSSHFIINR